jgi:hypothetical protein
VLVEPVCETAGVDTPDLGWQTDWPMFVLTLIGVAVRMVSAPRRTACRAGAEGVGRLKVRRAVPGVVALVAVPSRMWWEMGAA